MPFLTATLPVSEAQNSQSRYPGRRRGQGLEDGRIPIQTSQDSKAGPLLLPDFRGIEGLFPLPGLWFPFSFLEVEANEGKETLDNSGFHSCAPS